MESMRKLAVMALGLAFLPVVACASPAFVQEHFRWRNDDGSEVPSTWKAAADTAITGVTRGQNIRLRFSVSNTGTGSGTLAAKLEYSTSSTGPWTAVGTDGSGVTAFEMTATTNYADGAATTALLTGTGAFVAGKAVESPDNTSQTITIDTNQYSNFEFCFKATAKARGNTAYYFRMSNNGTALTTYSKTAQLTTAAGEANEAPAIKSALTAIASTVSAFNYQILASGSEPITYGASGLPAGLSRGTNTIFGTPTASGAFNVGLTASNTWGSNVKTLVLTVVGNLPPLASNQTASIVQAGEALIQLMWSDSDTPALAAHTFTIVSGASRGVLQSYNQRYGSLEYPNYYYYKADSNFTGQDTFTWKCRDADNDSNIGTCTVTVMANSAPVADSTSATISGGLRTGVSLAVTHADEEQTLTYTQVSGPSHGTLEPNQASGFWYYTPAGGYAGADSFTWSCNDGAANSGIATVTLTVAAAQPVPQNQTVCVAKNVPLNLPAAFTGGGGYSCTVVRVAGPSHGTVSVTNATMFRYVPSTNYTGPDSFTWKVNYWNATTPSTSTVTVSCWMLVKEASTNWPTFRADAHRTGLSPENLPGTLRLQWVRTLPLARQAWPGAGAGQVWPGAKNSAGYFNTTIGVYMGIDFNYEPIVADGKVFIGSNRDDCLIAYDAATGLELWRAHTGGPIRMAPLYDNGRVYAGSDDSFIYCWDANTGALIWKRQAVSGTGEGTSLLSRKKVFGNLRMISPWAVRGGLMMNAGVLYFASGLWPLEGTFVGALHPETGKTLWMSDGAVNAPQGYLVVSDGGWYGAPTPNTAFLVPCGKSQAGVFPLYTGPLSIAGVRMGLPGLSLRYEWAMLSRSEPLDPGVEPLGCGPKNGSTWVVYHDTINTGMDQWPSTITAGLKTYAAADVTALGVVGTVWRIIAANGRLFALTEGSATVNPRLYCFGGNIQPNPATWALNVTPLASPNDVWKTRAARILSESGVNDKGVALVLGIGSGRLVDELLLQSSLHVVAVDSDTNKVQTLRHKLSAAGLYGVRGSVICGEPMTEGLPPYMGRLIVSEDVLEAGWADGPGFAKSVFRSLRPYDGKAWLFTTGGQHTTFAGWVVAANLTNSTVARDNANEFSVLTRAGALPGAMEWTAANGAVTNVDQTLRGSLGVLWYGDTMSDIAGACYIDTAPPDLTQGRLVAGSGRSVDVYSGAVLTGTKVYSGAKTLGALNVGVGESPDGQRRSPVFGLRESGYPNVGGVHCAKAGQSFGRMRVGGAVYAHDIGRLEMPFKVSCQSGNGNGIAANGLVVWPQQQGCDCERTPQTSLALVHEPDPEYWVENFGAYSFHRLAETIEEVPIMRLGVNFGAPNEHMNTNGMLWMRENGVYLTPYEPATAKRYYHHSVRMVSSEGPKWVAASGLKGATKIRIPVAWTPVAQWVNNAPAIDGNLSDACWDGANPTLLNRVGTGSGSSWFRYDMTNLYVGAMVANPGDQNAIFNGQYSALGWSVHLSDRSQLTASWAQKGLSLDISAHGVKSGSVLYNGGPSAGGTTSALARAWSGAIAWSGLTNCAVEYAIPWSSLAAEGFRREKLLINIQGPADVNIRASDNYFVPLHLDTVPGPIGNDRPYKVRLHFAETEGALAGERVFDVKLQGSTVLSNFDVFTAAFGADRGIVREFTGVSIGNELVVEFAPKVGDPVISGVELEGQFTLPNQAPILQPGRSGSNFYFGPETIEPEGDSISFAWKLDGVAFTSGIYTGGPNPSVYKWGWLSAWSFGSQEVGEHRINVTADDGHGGVTSYEWTQLVTGSNSLPSAVFTASQTVGVPGMTVDCDATGSVDTNGSIVSYVWDYGDGTTGSGITASHTFTNAGSYNIRLTVTDNGGAKVSTNVMIHAIARPGTSSARITSALTANGTVGQTFTYTITASGTTPITYGATGLPAGLSRTGAVISGIPATAGTNNVMLTAMNAYGGATNTLVLKINAAPVNPDENANGLPDAWEVTNFGGTNVVNGRPQDDWDHDGMCNLAEYIAGTSPTNANSRCQVSGVGFQGGAFGLTFQTVTGRLYTGKYCDNLVTGGWGVLAPSNIAGTGGQITLTDTNRPTVRFYRLGVKLQ
ncbi:MAG: hypothetical protein C0404_06510 [Verrucomicrobia bacterium]|nr:hypothetical protein [Verrucomicrobiota bacterium]